MTAIQAVLSKIITMADRSLKIHFDTQELEAEEMTEIFKLYGKAGYIFFAEKSYVEPDIKSLPEIKVDKNEKTKAQRLRATLFRVWEQTSKDKISFDEFYNLKMEELINHFKSKLN